MHLDIYTITFIFNTTQITTKGVCSKTLLEMCLLIFPLKKYGYTLPGYKL